MRLGARAFAVAMFNAHASMVKMKLARLTKITLADYVFFIIQYIFLVIFLNNLKTMGVLLFSCN